MKTHYVVPVTNTLMVHPYPVLIGVSGGNTGMQDGGQDDGTHAPQAPRKPF
jgi:hypothetical protein